MRITVIKWFFIIFFGLISLRLFYWQVVKADELSAKAEGQHFVGNKLQAKRGNIFFTDGSVLASTKPNYALFANPKDLNKDQKERISLELAKIFAALDFQDQNDIKREVFPIKVKIDEKLSQDRYWVSIRKNLEFDVKNKIEQLSLPSVGFDSYNKRFYPEGSSAAHLLGIVAADAKGDDKGYFGIEGYFDGELRGISGFISHEKDALGIPILIGQFFGNEANNGKDLTLNIDRTVQFITEKYLKSGIEKYGAKAASAIVMDPKTGAVLALATYPNYDPAAFGDYPKEFYKNSIVSDQYEPGSTFKVLTMAAGINEGVVKIDTKCDICDKPIELGGFTIKTWNNQYMKDATMKEVIIHSDNTGMVFMANKLGLDKMYAYIDNFGFGSNTGIDLQDEFSPDLRSKNAWREIDLATASFGQGIAVTPIQMVRAVSAVANGGYLMEPHIVRQIKDENKTYEIKPKIVRKVLEESTTKTIKEMMVAAVEEGEAKVFAPRGFKIAGKTGTAQIPVAGHYDAEHTIASFVGFAPADDPKFIMLIRYDQPSSSIYGAETAAPTFFAIAKELFPYFKIAPTE